MVLLSLYARPALQARAAAHLVRVLGLSWLFHQAFIPLASPRRQESARYRLLRMLLSIETEPRRDLGTAVGMGATESLSEGLGEP